MAIVHRAYDVQSRCEVAIKIVDLGPDEARTRDSFMREAQALSDLPHPNVVRLIDVDRLDDQRMFLVLEWVDRNLEDWIAEHGAMTWRRFYQQIGRPLLEAVVHMQRRDWIHRDIKPKNILIDGEGSPKIADYGLAKRMNGPIVKGTFRDFSSPPYTPPEHDDDQRWSFARDCFSFAATTLFCLAGRAPTDYGELDEELRRLPADAPHEILTKALSSTPSERPATASVLLAELEDFESEIRKRDGLERRTYHLKLSKQDSDRLARLLSVSDGRELAKEITADFGEVVAFEPLRKEDRRHPDDGLALEVRILGARLAVNAGWAGSDLLYLEIYNVYPLSPAELGRLRENAYRPAGVELTFDRCWDAQQARVDLEALVGGLAQHVQQGRLAALDNQRSRVFRIWYAFLKEKAQFEAKRESPIRFVSRRHEEGHYVLTAEHPVSQEIVGQSRVVKVAIGVQLFCDVLHVAHDEITVRVTSGDESRLPQRGNLAVDVRAAQRALERQRAALDAIFHERAAAPELKELLADPSRAKAPRPVTTGQRIDDGLDDEKRTVVEHSMGLQDVLAIQGPPGTGKTRLIAEIVVQQLNQNPSARILLASQTHIALDNVIERLQQTTGRFDIVRVGKLDDVKIARHSQELLLDRKAERWLEEVRGRAEANMSTWALENGLSREQIETGMLAERLLKVVEQASAAEMEMRGASEAEGRVQKRIDDALSDAEGIVGAELEREAGDTQRVRTAAELGLRRLRDQESELRDRLRAGGGYGSELADGPAAELEEWSQLLISDEPTAQQCRRLLELLEEWLLRVGRSSDFQAAILAGSNVIAGTCVGVASVRGLSEVAFDLCIVDEASKATATETLVPMARARRWILVGDPRQLPPFFENAVDHDFAEHTEEELRETVLDRMLARLPSHSKFVLTNQYRMTAAIGDLISACFYEGTLNSPVKAPKVVLTGALSKPVTWLDTSGSKKRRQVLSGQSFENPYEAEVVRTVLARIDYIARRRGTTYDVAVIAGYLAQVGLIEAMIRDRYEEWKNIRVECNTVDAFQGREAEICIYSATRSNEDNRLGFLKEPARLNVALSRGRSALVVVGDAAFFRAAKAPNPFAPVLRYMSENPSSCDVRLADVS